MASSFCEEKPCSGLRDKKGSWAHPRSTRGFLCTAWAGGPQEGNTPRSHSSRWRQLGPASSKLLSLSGARVLCSPSPRVCLPCSKGVPGVGLESRAGGVGRPWAPRLAVAPGPHHGVIPTLLGT